MQLWSWIVISKLKSRIYMYTLSISCQTALRWMPQQLTDDKSTLVQVIAWCRQAPSHYLSQCWPRSMSPNGITRPQWVKLPLKMALGWVLNYYIPYKTTDVITYPYLIWVNPWLVKGVPAHLSKPVLIDLPYIRPHRILANCNALKMLVFC